MCLKNKMLHIDFLKSKRGEFPIYHIVVRISKFKECKKWSIKTSFISSTLYSFYPLVFNIYH